MLFEHSSMKGKFTGQELGLDDLRKVAFVCIPILPAFIRPFPLPTTASLTAVGTHQLFPHLLKTLFFDHRIGIKVLNITSATMLKLFLSIISTQCCYKFLTSTASASSRRCKQVFHLRSEEAAEHLGISHNSLKRLNVRLGIGRWPARKLSSLSHLSKRVQSDERLCAESRQVQCVRVCVPYSPTPGDLYFIRCNLLVVPWLNFGSYIHSVHISTAGG